MDGAKTTARGFKKHLNFGILCDLYKRFYGSICPGVQYHNILFATDNQEFKFLLCKITDGCKWMR